MRKILSFNCGCNRFSVSVAELGKAVMLSTISSDENCLCNNINVHVLTVNLGKST